MVLNFPGPYQLRIHYSVGGSDHVQQLNLDLATDGGAGQPFSTHSVTRNGLGPSALDALVDFWIDLIDGIYNSGQANFIDAELWKYTPESFDATFHGVYAIGQAGASAGATQFASQGRLSFITSTGGAMFIDFIDMVLAPGETDNAPFADTDIAAIAAYVLGTGGWFIGRDGSWPIAARKWNPGQNEAYWKKLNRN